MASLFLAGWSRLRVSQRASSVCFVFFLNGECRHVSSSDWSRLLFSWRVSSLQDEVVCLCGLFLFLRCLFRIESRPFSCSLALADGSHLRVSRRVISFCVLLSSSPIGVVFVFHVASLPCWMESSSCFTASLYLVLRLLSSRRVFSLFFLISSLPIVVVFVIHGESIHCRMKSFACFIASRFLFPLLLSSRRVSSCFCLVSSSLRVSSLQDGDVFVFYGAPLPFASSSFFTPGLIVSC